MCRVVTLLLIFLFLGACVYIMRNFGGNAVFPADCAIVFGAAVHGKQSAGPGIARRVTTAATLYENGRINTLYMTGGKGRPLEDSEAAVMRQYALDIGVPSSVIFTENTATSTWENIQKTHPMVLEAGCTSVVAISDRYHLARIRQLAAKEGWSDLMVHPADLHSSRLFEARSIAREAIAVLYYFFQ